MHIPSRDGSLGLLPGLAVNKNKIAAMRRLCPPGSHYNEKGSCVPNSVGSVGAPGRGYRVVAGDNIFTIANKHGVAISRVGELLNANPGMAKVQRKHGLDFARLGIGNTLTIPASWSRNGGGRLAGTGTVGAADSYTPSIPGVCVPPYYYDQGSGECVVGCPVGYSMTSSGCQPDAPNCVPGSPCQSGGLPGQYNNACNCEVLPGAGSGTPVDCQALTGRSDCYPDPSGPGGCMCPEAQLDCAALTGRNDFTACGGGCTFCGPNAVVNTGDCGCDCLPGFMPDPSGLEGSGCVPIPDGTPVNNNGQPIDNGGQPIGGDGPPPAQVNTASSTSEEESNTGTLLLGAALVLGLGFGAYKMSKKSLSTSRKNIRHDNHRSVSRPGRYL